jgi:hypothetical protein
MHTRRTLLLTSSTWLLLRHVPAIAADRLSPSDPDAFAAGFVLDISKVDTKRFPPNPARRPCRDCRSFKGSPSDGWWAMCGVYDKEVPAQGWCSAFRSRTA